MCGMDGGSRWGRRGGSGRGARQSGCIRARAGRIGEKDGWDGMVGGGWWGRLVRGVGVHWGGGLEGTVEVGVGWAGNWCWETKVGVGPGGGEGGSARWWD